MATPSKRLPARTPPDKGSFPLDHFGDCTQFQHTYLACVKEHKSESAHCKPLMKEYLECRMAHALMAKEDLNQLGFATTDTGSAAPASAPAATPAPTAKK